MLVPFIIIAFLIVYFLLCFYIAYNGWVWLKLSFQFTYKKTYFIVMLLISISFFLHHIYPFFILSWVGYTWMLVMLYSLIVLPIFNLIYFLNKKRGIKWFGYAIFTVLLFVFIYGSYNVWNPIVVSYDVEIEKKTELDELKILMVSDIHINETIGSSYLNWLINKSKEIKPDIIFLAGDVIDNSIEPYLKNKVGETLSGLKAPMGVYAVLGNHEYYGGHIPIFLEEMNDIDVSVLVDEVTNIDDLFYVVGREDYSSKDRKSIEELTHSLNKEKPIFLIDHQPRELEKASAAGVDIMVSGHTHKGQLFPGNYITKAIFENHYGLYKKENLHSIVSSGFGLWGPPFRIGSRSEVVEINVTFVN